MRTSSQLFDQYAYATGMQFAGSEGDFRAACARRCADPALKDLPVIRRIAGVGALGFKFGGTSQDDRVLTRFLIDAYSAGLCISPDFAIDCVNFTQRRDFLRENWSYDAVVVCFILGFPKFRSTHTQLTTYDPQARDHDAQDFGHALSVRHTAAQWLTRIKQSGAQLIMTYGSREEVNSHDLEHKYSLVEVLGTCKTPGRVTNGYLVRPIFAKAYRAHASSPLVQRTTLGRALSTAKLQGFFDPAWQDKLNAIFHTAQSAGRLNPALATART